MCCETRHLQLINTNRRQMYKNRRQHHRVFKRKNLSTSYPERKIKKKSSSTLLPEPALKPATLEMMRKKRKRRKKKRKRNWKKKKLRNNNISKRIERKRIRSKKAARAEKNSFSVFKMDNEEDYMEDDSVVFTDSSSSHHLPKGTLSRLPTT